MTAANSGGSDHGSGSSSWNREVPLSSSVYLQCSMQTAVSDADTSLRPAAPGPVSRAAGVAAAAGRSTTAPAADVSLFPSGATASSRVPAAAGGTSSSPFLSRFVDASVAASPAKTAPREGPAAAAASAPAGSASPFLPAAGFPPSAAWSSRPSSAAAASTAATTPAAAATLSAGAAGSRRRLLRDEQQAAAASASVVTPPAAEAVFLLHSADLALVAKSFGHPLPSPHLSVSRLAAAAASPFSTPSSPGALPPPLATPSYCQLAAAAPSSRSPAAAACPSSSEGVCSLLCSILRWLLLQLLLLLSCLYGPSFFPLSSSSRSSYLEAAVLRVSGWCSACLCPLVSFCLRLFFFFPRLLRRIRGGSPPPQQRDGLQGALAAGVCSADVLPCAAAPALRTFAAAPSASSFASSAASSFYYLIADGACSSPATQVDGGGVLLLTQLLPAAAAPPGVAGWNYPTVSRSSPRYLTSSSAVLYGHSPAAVILRNVGKTSSVEAAFGVAAYPPPAADSAAAAADKSPAAVSPALGGRETAAAAPSPQPAASWARLLWQRLQQPRKTATVCPCRYPTAAVVLCPPASTALLLVGYSDGRLETLQAASAVAAANSTSSSSSGCGWNSRGSWDDSSGAGTGCSSRFYGGVRKSVWFASPELLNEASLLAEASGDGFPSPPAEAAAAAADGAGMQPGLTAASAGDNFPLWQLAGVEWLQGPVLSLRASPCNTRICALTSQSVYVFEIPEDQQQSKAEESPPSSCYSSSSREAAGGCSRGGGGLRRRWFYRTTRFSSLFAFGKEALYCCCTPLACCWTNSRQLLLLCSNGKLSVFCRDPRRVVGEWRCVARLQLDAAARKSLRSAMQRSSSRSSSRSAGLCNSRGTDALATSSSRSEQSVKWGDVSRKSRDLARSSSSSGGETTDARDASEDDSRRAGGKRDVGLQGRPERRKERQRRTATPLRHSGGEEMLYSPSPLFSSPSLSAGDWGDTPLGETATAAAEETWRRSFPVAVLEYSASLQLLYLSIREHAVLLVIPWKALYACVNPPSSSSSFFRVSLSSPFCAAAAAALPRLSSRGWRGGGAGGLLSSLARRLLHRNEQLLAPLYEIDFTLPVWMQTRRPEKKQQQQQTPLLGRQAQRQRQQISGCTAQQFLPGAAASTSQHDFTEQQQRNAARREAEAAAAKTRELNEEAVGGAAWLDVDNATKRRSTLDIQAEKKQLVEQQQLGNTRPLQTSDVGGILSFALTTEAAGASYVAVLHAGCSSVFVYDASFLAAGDVLLPDPIRNDVGAYVLPEEQQQARAPVIRFCVPPPWAGCRPAALAFLSPPSKKTPPTCFFSPSSAACAAADAGILLLGVRWVYPGVSRSEEGEVKEAMLPVFTAFYSLPSVAAADAAQQIDSSWLRTPSAAQARGLLPTAVPPLSPLLSASLPPASAAFLPVGVGASSASSAAAAFSARMAAAEQETLDAWRAAARLGVPADSAAVNAATAGACRGSSSSVWGTSSFTQRNACTGRFGCSSSADFPGARGSNPLDACGDSNNSPPGRRSRNACDPSCDSVPLDAYKEEFFTPASLGISSGEIDNSQRWRTEGKASAQSGGSVLRRATATRVVPASTGIGEVSDRLAAAAAEGNLPSGRLSAWNCGSPFLVDSNRFAAGRGTAADLQQGDMVNSSALPLGRSSSRAGASGYYDMPKNALEGRDAPAADDVWLTQGETSWLQRWQLHQQKLMQRWQLLQHQQQRMDQQALQSLYQSDLEIPRPLPSSFSRWTSSYPRVSVQRPAPYSFLHPYSSTGLSRLCGLQRSSCYDAMPLQQQRLSQQQQLPFMCRTRALESGELLDTSRWPLLSPQPPGLFSSAAANCSFSETVAGGASASLPAQGDSLQQAFVDTRNFTNRQKLFNDDFSMPAYRPALDHSVNVSVLQHESPATNARSTSLRQQQQLGCSTSVPAQNCAGLLTANTANNVLQHTLPVPPSPARVAAGTSNLNELGLSKCTEVGGAAGQDYMDACYSQQRNPLGASGVRLSNSSMLQPFSNSTWTAKYINGPRTSVL